MMAIVVKGDALKPEDVSAPRYIGLFWAMLCCVVLGFVGPCCATLD